MHAERIELPAMATFSSRRNTTAVCCSPSRNVTS